MPPGSYTFYMPKGDPYNELGLTKKKAGLAKILFTTKEQIKYKTHGERFENTQAFFYKGLPRQVRILAESLIEGSGIEIRRTEIAKLLAPIEEKMPFLLAPVETIVNGLKKYKDGEYFTIPRLEVSMNDFVKIFSDEPQSTRDLAKNLWLLSGKTVPVLNTAKGEAILDFVIDIPSDFKPCLVIDESSRLREIYSLPSFKADFVLLK